MYNWIKIYSPQGQTFFIEEISSQLTIVSMSDIHVKFDISKFPDYVNFFFDKFEMKKKFDLDSKESRCKGVFIKTIDLGSQYLNVSMRCDYFEFLDVGERRDEILEDLLNNGDNNS